MKLCPECKTPLKSMPSPNNRVTKVRLYCTNCSSYLIKDIENPSITAGRQIAKQFEGIGALDPRMTRLSGATQLGILRQRQHPRKS